MQVNIEELVNFDLKGTPGGVGARFVPLNEKWGVKLFKYQRTRDHAYKTQKMVYDAVPEAAPQVGDKLDLPENNEHIFIYGYITERVETPFTQSVNDFDNYNLLESAEVWYQSIRKEVRETIKRVEELTGWEMLDDHRWNFGLRNGKVVIIDFGDDGRY